MEWVADLFVSRSLPFQECEKLITQLGKIADDRIEEFLAKARTTRKELEKTLLASSQH